MREMRYGQWVAFGGYSRVHRCGEASEYAAMLRTAYQSSRLSQPLDLHPGGEGSEHEASGRAGTTSRRTVTRARALIKFGQKLVSGLLPSSFLGWYLVLIAVMLLSDWNRFFGK